jgi:hypothetical protein
MTQPLRIASISLVKDEGDIIEVCIRHNRHFIDRMYVIDMGSTDCTKKILEQLSAEDAGLRVQYETDELGFYQASRTTRAMHDVMNDEPWDYIFPLDADEFICASSALEFQAALRAIPKGSAGAFKEMRYIASRGDDPKIADPLVRIRTALPPGGAPFKAIISKEICEGGAILEFSEGNHGVIRNDAILAAAVISVPLAHFAVRSLDQIAIKCLKHYVGWKSRADYQKGIAGSLIDGAVALKSETSFELRFPSSVFATYCAGYPIEQAVLRPFKERRGSQRWPELAQLHPFRQVLSLLDQLMAPRPKTKSWARLWSRWTD